ncbi:MAG: DNA alkylation repair protein [Bacteroidia bacterium]|nr:DNA alkylation repair protein [Bacteroidia bacterium]
MNTISQKSQLAPLLSAAEEIYRQKGIAACAKYCEINLLTQKCRFPLLEYFAQQTFQFLREKDVPEFCTEIQRFNTIGGHVITGILLQLRLPDFFGESLLQAALYISQGTSWHICDIIGERVFGEALRKFPEQAIPEVRALGNHPSNLVVRALGAGIHNAVKWGLNEKYVAQLFQFLLTMRSSKDKEIKQGIGWAAKTCVKFYPQLVKKFEAEINSASTPAWFRTKINIGITRSERYAGKY